MKEEDAKKIMSNLREDYNLAAVSFARSRDRMWEELKFLFDKAEEGDVVLDLGCGNGRFSQYLEKTTYFGIDFSQKLINEAEKRFPKKSFLQADALNLPFENDFFDKIYSIAVIHQIPSHNYRLKALKETKRVLKSGGKIYFTAWEMDEETKGVCQKSGEKDVFLKRDRYYYLFEKEEFIELFREAGFFIEESGIVCEGKRSNFYVVARKKS